MPLDMHMSDLGLVYLCFICTVNKKTNKIKISIVLVKEMKCLVSVWRKKDRPKQDYTIL